MINLSALRIFSTRVLICAGIPSSASRSTSNIGMDLYSGVEKSMTSISKVSVGGIWAMA